MFAKNLISCSGMRIEAVLIVTTLRLRVAIDSRKELLQTLGSLYQPISSDRGLVSRQLYSEIDNDSAVLLVEEWESEGHWTRYLQSNEFAVLLGAMILVDNPKAVEFKVLFDLWGVESLKKLRARRTKGLLIT
jgi:quinol monooxygenase YgiN